MAQSGLGVMLEALREQRGLSLRELGQLSGVDHAYIYRLETGDKEAPSGDVLNKLIRALKPAKREAEMLRYVATHADIDPAFVFYVLKNTSVTIEVFTAAAGAVYRGNVRPDYPRLIDRVRRILSEEDFSG